MTAPFRFQCSQCGDWHEGLPDFDWDAPVEYLSLPALEREARAELTSDTCVIDRQWFFLRSCLEIPIHGQDQPLMYGLWVSVSEKSFALFQQTYEQSGREHTAPFFAWLTAVPPPFPQVLLKAMVHLRPLPVRPALELEPTEHPLAIAQREGISQSMALKIASTLWHSGGKS
jgi:hypothetical protein